MIDILLVLGTLALLLRIYVPWGSLPGGEFVRRYPLPLLARIRLHRGPMLLLLVAGAAGIALDRVRPETLGLAALAMIGVLAVPVAYTLTDEAIVLGRTRPRRWTEFAGVGRRRGGACLQTVPGSRGMSVWLSDSRGDDELVLQLRQLVRASYKGQIGPITRQPAAADDDPRRPAHAWEPANAAGR